MDSMVAQHLSPCMTGKALHKGSIPSAACLGRLCLLAWTGSGAWPLELGDLIF